MRSLMYLALPVAVWLGTPTASAQAAGDPAPQGGEEQVDTGECTDPASGFGVCARERQLVEAALRISSLSAGLIPSLRPRSGSPDPLGSDLLLGQLALASASSNANDEIYRQYLLSRWRSQAASTLQSASGVSVASQNVATATPVVQQTGNTDVAEIAASSAALQAAQQAELKRLCPDASDTGLEICIKNGRQYLQAMRAAVRVAERDLSGFAEVEPARLDARTRARLRTTVEWVAESLRRVVELEQNIEFLEAERARRQRARVQPMGVSADSSEASGSPGAQAAPLQSNPSQPAQPFAMAALNAANAFLLRLSGVVVGRANASTPQNPPKQ